ncbi:MAG: RNA polymerase factor sigma-54 [Mariprofundales bacterium]
MKTALQAGLHAGLQTKLTQHLSPRMVQSLKMLEMNILDLHTCIGEYLEKNPLLENDADSLDSMQDYLLQRVADNNQKPSNIADDNFPESKMPLAEDSDTKYADEWIADNHLWRQVHVQLDRQPMSSKQRNISHLLLDSLDDDGYLRCDNNELIALAKLADCSVSELDDVLHNIIHQLEPLGLGARNLHECFLLQLNNGEDSPSSLLACRLLRQFSELLHEPDAILVQAVGCSSVELAQARQRLRCLDAFPGHGLRESRVQFIRPELVIHQNESGNLFVEIPNMYKIRLNHSLMARQWSQADKVFIEQAKQEAQWLISALEQRQQSLYAIGLCLIKRQEDFLRYGILLIKPLTMREVAADIGVHESTVSRMVAGKYAQTPVGVLELRSFFVSGLQTSSGITVTTGQVQQRIRSIIAQEEPLKAISDDNLAKRLQREGLDIARRTVAKYRTQLNIPSSSKRKQIAKAIKKSNE